MFLSKLKQAEGLKLIMGKTRSKPRLLRILSKLKQAKELVLYKLLSSLRTLSS